MLEKFSQKAFSLYVQLIQVIDIEYVFLSLSRKKLTPLLNSKWKIYEDKMYSGFLLSQDLYVNFKTYFKFLHKYLFNILAFLPIHDPIEAFFTLLVKSSMADY